MKTVEEICYLNLKRLVIGVATIQDVKSYLARYYSKTRHTFGPPYWDEREV